MALTRDKLFWDAFTAHANATVEAASLLREMLEGTSTAAALAPRIAEVEERGDKITHETIAALHATWITPLDRDEIHELICALDDVLDSVDSASQRVALLDVGPTSEAAELASILEASARDVARAVAMLTDMKQAPEILELCHVIGQHENRAGTVVRRGLARLYAAGDAIAALRWRDVYEDLEGAADHAEEVANIIEGIVLEHS